MRIEILCTGDEILTGKTINTNYSHMARRLGEVGLEVVHWGTTVGDDRASLLAAFRQAARAGRCGHRQWRARPDRRRPVAGGRGRGGRRAAGAARATGWRAWRTSTRGAAG